MICDVTIIVTKILKNSKFHELVREMKMMCVLFVTLKLGDCLVEE